MFGYFEAIVYCNVVFMLRQARFALFLPRFREGLAQSMSFGQIHCAVLIMPDANELGLIVKNTFYEVLEPGPHAMRSTKSMGSMPVSSQDDDEDSRLSRGSDRCRLTAGDLCRPCLYYYTGKGCSAGPFCGFCHMHRPKQNPSKRARAAGKLRCSLH